ncbi:multidrug effflux MFS transporter [soil metagenome]
MKNSARPVPKWLIILILGVLTALSPFSIDMYLSAFPEIAKALDTTVAKVSLSLSSYFVGLAIGQLFYGPLLDRYGRKRPLYAGLTVYILSSVGCLFSHTIEGLIVFRFLQALGGCAASVATMAMVRDLFTLREGAKVLSLLILILGASPLLAPSVGSYVSLAFGWHSVFVILMGIAILLLATVKFVLPETHRPDATVVLRFLPIVKSFAEILREPQFYAFTLAGAVAFSGLFVYVAGSPLIFMGIFKVTPQVYGWIFAGISVGFIGSSQLNIFFLRYYRNEQVLKAALVVQAIAGLLFLVAALVNQLSLPVALVLLFFIMGSVGFANPNAASLALAPFERNAGRAAALMGFLQMGIGATATVGIGLIGSESILPTAVILASSGTLGFVILTMGTRGLVLKLNSEPHEIPSGH